MSKDRHAAAIALEVANQNVNTLISALAEKCAEIDALKAELAAFKTSEKPAA